jgi:hypothetical protein
MADRETIARIAKILARASSDNPHEAEAALQGAYKRMKQDGVTLTDLLALSDMELFPNTLVKLVDVILDDQPNLSMPARERAYAQYILRIAQRFAEVKKEEQGSSRQEEANEYEKHRREQESQRRQNDRPPPHREDKEYKRQNSNTPKHPYNFADFSFSPASFFALLKAVFYAIQPFFRRGSFVWCTLVYPAQAFPLFVVSLLFGCAFAGIVLVAAAVVHVLTHTMPLWDIQLANAFSFLVAIGAIWKARMLFMAGWFR